MYADLHSFVDDLSKSGELIRISETVDPVLEIAQRADIASKTPAPHLGSRDSVAVDPEFSQFGGSALLFENPLDSSFPVLINTFGSYSRMEQAFGGESFEELAARISQLVKPELPRSLSELIAKAKMFTPLLRIGPKRINRSGLCQEVVHLGDDIDLTTLPILRCWEHDGDFETLGYPKGLNDSVPGMGHPDLSVDQWNDRYRGRFITLAGIHTIHASDRHEEKPQSHNIGMYRVQLLGKNKLAMHWHMHHDGASHWRSWKEIGEPMPVAIALGGPAVLPYAATCPLPPGISELLMAGFLNGKGIKLCRAKTVPIWVPADSEMIIEGEVNTDAGFPGWDPRQEDAGALGNGAVFEGPFGDHTGFYSMPDRYPVVNVKAFTHRKNAMYPTTVVGLPPQEDYFLGKATERIMLPLLKTILPDIQDYNLPLHGAFHNVAHVQIDKQYPLHARKVMHGIWGAGQMAWTKNLFVVDNAIDVHDMQSVFEQVCLHCVPSRDITLVDGPLDVLDHAAPRLGSGTKLGFDATPKWTGEDVDGKSLAEPNAILNEKQRKQGVDTARKIKGVLDARSPVETPGWLFVQVDKDLNEPERAGLGEFVMRAMFAEKGDHRFIVILGRSVHIANHHSALFHWAANTDARRDAYFDRSFGCDRVGFDATPKTTGDERNQQPVREWPPVLPATPKQE